MIQYNNFLMKREQSRAGSRFAECEKSRLKAKILITLALLLTAVTGAWAQEEYESFDLSSGNTTVNGTHFTITGTDGMNGYGLFLSSESVTVTSLNGENITRVEFIIGLGKSKAENITGTPGTNSCTNGNENGSITDINATSVTLSTENTGTTSVSIKQITVYYCNSEPAAPITVEPVEGKTNEWTFSMPGSDVVLTPQYAPAAQLAENGAPAAVSGLEIAADAAIITAGQSAQGTLLYAVGTSETEKPALTAFSATLPNAKELTAAGTYYVWYYIQGHDTPQGQEPSAENTFNDSEIMGPVIVELLTNEHTLNIKQSPNITVTVAGTAKTPTDDKVTPVTTGQEVKIKANTGYKFRKVEVKKGAPATALAPALENGATVVIICNWGYATTTFTYTNNGGTFSSQASGYDADYFHNGLELNGKNLSFGASDVDIPEFLSVGITFNTESSAYSYTGKGEAFASFTISVNGTDVTDQLSELK